MKGKTFPGPLQAFCAANGNTILEDIYLYFGNFALKASTLRQVFIFSFMDKGFRVG